MEGNNPLQHRAAMVLVDKARRALEHALPRGCDYVLVVAAPGFCTVASNLDKANQLELVQGAAGQLSSDLFQGRT